MDDRTTETDATVQALSNLASLAERHIFHVDGAAVTLLEHEGIHRGASNELAREVDDVQYGCGEGPCISAIARSAPMTSGRIGAGETRWPLFAEGSVPMGLRSVLSFPLHGPERIEGSLNLYSRRRHAFDAVAILQAEMFLHPLTAAIQNARVVSAIDGVATTLTTLLDDRTAIDIALGVLSSTEGLSIPAARRRLVEMARSESRPVTEAARALVEWVTPAPPGPESGA